MTGSENKIVYKIVDTTTSVEALNLTFKVSNKQLYFSCYYDSINIPVEFDKWFIF